MGRYLLLAKKYKLLLIIVVIAAVLRLYKLGAIPPHLTPDEAALGYNAYSIMKTGRDEYGVLMPIIFKSFGDYKPGLYIYLAVPSIAILGLNEFATRLPSALAGVVAVFLIYLISKRLFKKGHIGIITSLLLAVNPWHVHFSRGAWEVNLALTLSLCGIYFFLRSISNHRFLYFVSLFFSLTFLTYQGAKLSTSIIMIVLLISFWKEISKMIKSNIGVVLRSALIGFVIALPVLFSFFQGKTGRLEVFSVFSYPRPVEYLQAFLDQGDEVVGSVSYYLFHSEKYNFLRGIAGRWFNHFSGRFLFFEGDWQNVKHTPPNHGVLMLYDLVLLTFGFCGFVKYRLRSVKKFTFLWLFLSCLPAALTRDQVQAVRALNMVIPLTIVSTLGVVVIAEFIKRQKLAKRYLLVGMISSVIVVSVFYFLDAYFVHIPAHHAREWFYGYKQVVNEVTLIQNEYKNIIFQQSYSQPYIYFLFYQEYDPTRYQQQANLIEGGVDVGLVEKLDNISFEFFSWPASVKQGDLVVGDDTCTLAGINDTGFRLLREIQYPNDLVAFRIFEKL